MEYNWKVYIILVFSLMISTINLTEGQDEHPISNATNIYKSPSCFERPYRCPHPKIKFFLYTRATQLEGEQLNVLDKDGLRTTHWNPKHEVKMILHGFNSGRNLRPITDIRSAYFDFGEYNIITVDFGDSVREPCLSQLNWSPRFLALCIAHFLKYLGNQRLGVRPERIHILGYSMGSHIAGLVANNLSKRDGKIGRITGLDPSILFSTGSSNMTLDLDKTDAHFVDIIHTSAGVLGQWYPSGHADFYVNGGMRQVSCTNGSIVENLACDHHMVPKYFMESISSPLGFWGARCPNLVSYLVGWCQPKNSQLALMGEHANPGTRGIFYVTTNAAAPYAQGRPTVARSSNEKIIPFLYK